MSVFKKIDSTDITIVPFNVHKDYAIDSTNYSSSFGVQILQGTHYTHSFRDPVKGIPLKEEPKNPNGTYKGIIHDSINHLYYQRIDKPSENFGGNNPEKETRFLGEKAYVLSVPSTIFDLRIKSGSVRFTDHYIQKLPLDREKNLINLPYNASSSLFYTPFQSPTVYNIAPSLAQQYGFEHTASRYLPVDEDPIISSFYQSFEMPDLTAARSGVPEGVSVNTASIVDGSFPEGSVTGTGSLQLRVGGVDEINGIKYNSGNGLLVRKIGRASCRERV